MFYTLYAWVAESIAEAEAWQRKSLLQRACPEALCVSALSVKTQRCLKKEKYVTFVKLH